MEPYIILNCAASADGKIALPNRQKVKLSNEEDFARVHSLRSECEAIIVGIETVIEDNPHLTVNQKYFEGKNPLRIILDTNYRIPKDSKVLDRSSDTLIAIGEKTKDRKLPNIKIIRCGEKEINLEKLLTYIHKLGIKKVLVEGGETVIWSFLEKQLFDEFNLFISSNIIGGKETPTVAGGKGFWEEKNILKLQLQSSTKVGNGILIKYTQSKN